MRLQVVAEREEHRRPVDVEHRAADDRRAEQRDQVADRGQRHEHDHHRDHARYHEEAHGIDGERAQAVELLGHRHRRELRRVVRADAAREHQRDQDRPDLAQHRVARAVARERRRAELLHERARLEHHQRAGEERGERDDGHALVAHLVQVLHQLAPVDARRHERGEHLPGQQHDAADLLRDLDRTLADALDAARDEPHDASGPSSSPRTNCRTIGSGASAMVRAGPR